MTTWRRTRPGIGDDDPDPGPDGSLPDGDGGADMPDDVLVAGRYRLEKVIGTGGVGKVWRAVDTTSGRTVAVKLLLDEHANDQDTRRRLIREAGVLERLDQRNIVSVVSCDADAEGRLYLVMEYVDGPDLATTLLDGPLRPADAVEITEQLAAALTAAHDDGLIHRDLKPLNVLLEGTERPPRVVLIDFGIASLVGRSRAHTATNAVIGSEHYMSPERWRGRDVDHRSDVYSLGVVLFEMLVGRPPFQADTTDEVRRQHLDDPVPRPSADGSAVPMPFDVVVARAMAKSPDDRYATAEEMAVAARAALDGRPVAPPDRTGRRTGRRIAQGVVAATVTAAVATVVWLGVRPPTLGAEGTFDVGSVTTGAVAVVPGSDGGSRAFIGSEDGKVAVVDLDASSGSRVAGRVDVGGQPREIVVSADGTTVFVSTGSTTVVPIDVATLTKQAAHPIPAGPGRIGTLGTDTSAQVYGAGSLSGFQFDPRAQGYQTFAFDAAVSDVAVAGDRAWFLVPDDGSGKGRLEVLRTTDQRRLDPVVDLPQGASSVVATTDGTVYVAGSRELTVVDPAGGQGRQVPLGTTDGLRALTATGNDVYALTEGGSVLLVRGDEVVARTTVPDAGRNGVGADENGCVVIAGGSPTVDLVGDGSACRD